MSKIAYLGVSTAEQRPDRQIDGLRELCDELHIEKISAVAKRRPVYERVIRGLRPGDTFVVWSLDRAFRSLRFALNEIEELQSRGIGFQVASLQLDTNSPVGIAFYQVLGVFAEFERNMLSERTKEGMAAARKRGQRLGRPPKLNRRQLEDAKKQIEDAGETVKSVATHYKVAPWTLTRSLRRLQQDNL